MNNNIDIASYPDDNTPCTFKLKSNYQEIIRKLNWASREIF